MNNDKKSNHSQLFLVWLILRIPVLLNPLILYWDCFDVTSAFFVISLFFHRNDAQHTNNRHVLHMRTAQLMERMDRKTDELSIPLSIDRWKNATEDFAQIYSDTERIGRTMLEIGFKIKWSLPTTAFIQASKPAKERTYRIALHHSVQLGMERVESTKSSSFALCQCNACFVLFFSSVVRTHTRSRAHTRIRQKDQLITMYTCVNKREAVFHPK